jgi:hypothetical protein
MPLHAETAKLLIPEVGLGFNDRGLILLEPRPPASQMSHCAPQGKSTTRRNGLTKFRYSVNAANVNIVSSRDRP